MASGLPPSIPTELSYEILSNMVPSKKSEYRRQPLNASEFSTPGSEIQITISKMANSFLIPDTLAINFTVDYGNGVVNSFIIGSGYSHFNRMVWTALVNNQKLETIQNPGQLFNTIMNMTVEGMTKQSLETSMGFGEDRGYTNYGREINSANAWQKEQSYSLPIIGVMQTDKLIPAFVTDFQLDLTLASVGDFIIASSDASGNLPTGYTIKNVELVCEVLTLEEDAMRKILSSYPGILQLKSSTFSYGSSSLNAGYAGVFDITYSHSVQSLKEFIWWASPTDATDKSYGGVNPNLGTGGFQLIIGSTVYPQQPVKCDRAAECFYQIQKAWGALTSASHSGSITRNNFARASTASGEYRAYTSGALTKANILVNDNSNKWYGCLDLELINNFKGTLYSGISTKGSTNTFRLNVARTLKAGVNVNIHFYSHYDCILQFDYINGVVLVAQ